MANEISWANLETDAGLAAALSGEVHENLYDPTDLRMTARRTGFTPGAGSEAIKTPTINRAHTFGAASSEISGGASNESIGSGNFTKAVSRRLMKWQITELWQLVAPNGSIDLSLLAGIIIEGTGLTFTDLICTLFASLSVTAGSTTDQMSVDYMYDAQYLLNNARARPPFHMVLSPHGFNKWSASLRNEGGANQFKPATAEMINAKGPGFKGEYGNIMVWDSDSVTSDGGATYKRSGMYDGSCFEYTEAPVVTPLPSNVSVLVNGLVRIVLVHDADNALTSVIGDYYPAVVEAEDARGVQIRYLAA